MTGGVQAMSGVKSGSDDISHIDELTNGLSKDTQASCGGHGITEILRLMQILEGEGLGPCCGVGVSALMYYGASRVRFDWEICVQTEKLENAASLLRVKYAESYSPSEHSRPVQPTSLSHTFPRFKVIGVDLYFIIVPASDVHVNCTSSNIERSHSGVPYPKLAPFVQSALDRNDGVALCDLIDAQDLTEEWGEANLDLEGTIDVEWAKRKNTALSSSGVESVVSLCSTAPIPRSKVWERCVRNKTRRLGFKNSKELYATKYRRHGSIDPRLRLRTHV